jgi:hypothetical protein
MEPLIDHKPDIANPYRLAPGEILIKLLINHPVYFVAQDDGQLLIKLPNHANIANPDRYIIYSLRGNPLTNDSIMLNEFSQEEAEVIIEVYKYVNLMPGRFHRQENMNAMIAGLVHDLERDRLFPNAKPGVEDPLELTPAEALIKIIRRDPLMISEEDGKVIIQLPAAMDPENKGHFRINSLSAAGLSAETIRATRFSEDEQVMLINIFKLTVPAANLPNVVDAPAVHAPGARGQRLRGVPRGGKYTRRIDRVRHGRPSKKTRSKRVRV